MRSKCSYPRSTYGILIALLLDERDFVQRFFAYNYNHFKFDGMLAARSKNNRVFAANENRTTMERI